MAGSAATLAEIGEVGGHRIGTVQDLRIAMTLVTRRVNTASPASAPGEARVDLQTDVVIDTPDGTTWRVGSVSYQEDLAGVIVITAADPMPAGDEPNVNDPPAPGAVLGELTERLYDLDRDELRALAYEALLMSDGPDRVDGDVAPDHRIGVRLHGDEFVVAQQIDGDGRYPGGQ